MLTRLVILSGTLSKMQSERPQSSDVVLPSGFEELSPSSQPHDREVENQFYSQAFVRDLLRRLIGDSMDIPPRNIDAPSSIDTAPPQYESIA